MSKIIIAEDDPMIAEIYEKKFTEAGYEVAVADSGDQVLTLHKKNNPDIILLDLILPKMNGFEVIENIRKTDKDTKIIVFSNLNQAEDREKASQLGANGFVSKADYAPSDLVREVGRLTNQLREEKVNGEKEIRAAENGGLANNSETKGKILMMEDEEIFREMFGGKLKDDGFAVDFAEDGAAGMKKALAGNYALFIIDMIMPNITGEEIVVKLKREEKTKNIPIIILSASVDEAMQRSMEDTGIQGFFIKTQLVPSELSKKVGELLK
ncbi:MAG: response regulator [Parcubacteria group bacterium]